MYKLYITEKKGFRKIEKLTDVSVKTLRKIALHFEIPVRHGSDAVRSQWVDAEDRRKEQGESIRRRMTVHGRTKEYSELMNSGGHHIWRGKVKKRDGNKCGKCPSTVNLDAHHIKSILTHPKLRLVVSNGITLCHRCHSLIHRDENRKARSLS